MKFIAQLCSLGAAAVLFAASPAFAQHNHGHGDGHNHGAPAKAGAGKLIKVTKDTADWAAKERAKYPMQVCVVSGEKFGSMGKPAEYIYRVEGQPDRLVVFCCSGCDEDFMKDPAKHLSKIDAAAKTKGAAQGATSGAAAKPACACCAT